jgi:uncharacterized protein YggE
MSILFIASCSNPDKPKKIRVSGEGKIRVMPDQVILTINVSFTKPRMVDAVRQTQETVDSVQLILEQFGRKGLDIKTSSISANKHYEYIGNSNKFMGFQAQQTIDFVLNDISKFTELTGKLLETKINSIAQLQFNHSKADSLFREADLLAYDDALQSANKLTTRASVKLGNLLFISNDNTSSDGTGYSTGDRIDTYSKGYGGRGFKISPEVIEFKRNITTEFEITD